MNIYIHVEISSRELDSKLLLAILAASRGHEVLVSDQGNIKAGIRAGLLAPGIFHTKSLTPSKAKIEKHKFFTEKGFLITSIDEEAGLEIDGYDEFSKMRYSEKTIDQSSLVFTWGTDDTQTLKKKYFKHSSKIIKTGSPRVDLWRPVFSDYWGTPNGIPKKPFLLISSNLGFSNGMIPFHEVFKKQKKAGYYDREPLLANFQFGMTAENYQTTAAFIDAIKYLSKNNNGYDIVLRPHPAENVEIWNTYLENIPNVHVIREDSISAWVNNAFAVMHNGCTTAFEATISNKPLITYTPYIQKYGNELPNMLGYRIKSKEELLDKVNVIFNNYKSDTEDNYNNPLPEIVSKKIFIDNNELAAYKIVKNWNKLENQSLNLSSNWVKYKWLLRSMSLKTTLSQKLKKLLPSKFGTYEKNYKFPPFNKEDIIKRIKNFQKVLGIKEKIELKLLSERTILIKK